MNALLRDELVYINDVDKLAIESLARGGRSKSKRYLPGTIFIYLLWIGLGYIVYRGTENWFAVAVVGVIWITFLILGFVSERKVQGKIAKMMEKGSVRLVEGVVADYQLQDPKPLNKITKTLSLYLGDQTFLVSLEQVQPIRYGAKVQLRIETTSNTALAATVLAYGDHDLDWEPAPTPVAETTVDLSKEESDFEKKVLNVTRTLNLRYYGGITLIFSVIAGLSYWGFGWNWSIPMIGLLYCYLIFKSIQNLRRMPKNVKPLNYVPGKKSVMEGILVRREVEFRNGSNKVQDYFWVVGSQRRKIIQQHFVVAEPGDRVRLHSFGASTMPFLVERIAQRQVAEFNSDAPNLAT